MNELMTYENYNQFKTVLDNEILSAAESFVKIGWLLKQARDTNILSESGYSNLYEFAKAEYGIDKGTVSRYIAINDRFSIGGNAPELEDKYSGRGVAKLQEMLTMSDEVIDVIPEQTTKAEIQEIKRDIKAEEEITDIEVLMEEKDLQAEECDLNTLAKQSLYYYLKADKEAFKRMHEVFRNEGRGNMQEQIMKALAPSGIATPRTRIPQVGTILMSIQGLDHEMSFVNVRNNEKEQRAWLYIQDVMISWFGGRAGQSVAVRYEEFYGEKFEEVALVQPKIEQPEPAESNVHENSQNIRIEKENTQDEQSTETETGEETKEDAAAVEEQPDIQFQENVTTGDSGTEVAGADNKFPGHSDMEDVRGAENGENTIAEAEIANNSEIEASKVTESVENTIAEAEFREPTAEDHNRYMNLAEDIKKALFMQDYKEAKFKAEILARLLGTLEEDDE